MKTENAPLHLLQWLKPAEYRETKSVLAAFAKSLNISYTDALNKAEATLSIEQWLYQNNNSQFLFIGAHGISDIHGECIGIGKSLSDYMTWQELWNVLGKAELPPALWLGACKSAHIKNGWDKIGTPPCPASWIIGFTEPIYPIKIETILHQLIKNTDLSKIVYIDKEMDTIRAIMPAHTLALYYPVQIAGKMVLLDETDFRKTFSVSFKEFLIRNSR